MESDVERPLSSLYGMYRDVLRDRNGRVIWDSGWTKNAIVEDCRRLLSAFMRGAPIGSAGIQGLQVGAGSAAWDLAPSPPPPSPSQTALVDPNPFLMPRIDLQFDFLSGPVVSAAPTNRLQIGATFGPGVPPWPDGTHSSATLREFGLVADLDGSPVLINYRTHPAIPKDPASTLERTIWLTF
jgi:hypothetical protein